jgi:Xaa-Pro aminopeptidase
MNMQSVSPDHVVPYDNWSDLKNIEAMPEINFDRMGRYRLARIREQLKKADAAMCVLVSPVSLRYAVDYQTYGLFQSHVPTTYLFIPLEGPVVIHGAYGNSPLVDSIRVGRPLSVFDGGSDLDVAANLLADDIVEYLKEIGSSNRRVAVEYVNPSVTQALMRKDLEVLDGVGVIENARVIKSQDEISCMRWAIKVAEHGIETMRQTLKPGVSELQLWGLLNYTNIANDGDWHEGRMLASAPRTNPWLQEATDRRIEAGDLVGFDTDMVGPFGYCADISRTFFCSPGEPSTRQKQLYQLAVKEIEHNLKLVRPGISLTEFQKQAFVQEEEFHKNAYVCTIHGLGMCDEFPRIDPIFRGSNRYEGRLEAGMVVCVESFVGAEGEREGVKLEQQMLITEDGYQLLSEYPLEEKLLG